VKTNCCRTGAVAAERALYPYSSKLGAVGVPKDSQSNGDVAVTGEVGQNDACTKEMLGAQVRGTPDVQRTNRVITRR
jgi:hypothetical protein